MILSTQQHLRTLENTTTQMSLTMWLPVLEDVGGLDAGDFTINDFMARGSDDETDPETDPVPEPDTLLDLRIDPHIEPDEIESPPIRSPLIESPAITAVILTEITNTIHITYTSITTWITDE